MVWVILIHVIIEVTDISLSSKACLSRQVHFHNFSFCNCINFGGMAEIRNGPWNTTTMTLSLTKFARCTIVHTKMDAAQHLNLQKPTPVSYNGSLRI